MKSILITGCSSGFGLDIAKYFLERDWNVIATMRKPQERLFPKSDRLHVLALDVTDEASIQKAVKDAGPIDALVNNAGIGMLSSVEDVSMDAVREIYETNVFGPIAMIKAVLPQMRERQSGVIVNVTSGVTIRPLPLLSIYTGTKAAVNAYTESMAIELAEFNIRARIVLPGRSPETKFSENARERMKGFSEPYQPLLQKVMANFQNSTGPVTNSIDVAEAVFFAVTDASSPMRIPAGEDSKQEDAKRIAERR
jgi:NAD(P)-dependent dehydrogenase (short-subunit alcohol dehydrogenase family)